MAIGANVELAVRKEKENALKNLLKKEVSVTIPDLTVEKAAELLGEKYEVKTERKIGFKDNLVRVVYAPERSLIIKIKVDKKAPETANLTIYNEYGAQTYNERTEFTNEVANEDLKAIGKVALGAGKMAGKAALNVGKTAVSVGAAAVNVAKGDGASVSDSLAGAASGVTGGVGSVGEGIGNATVSSVTSVAGIIKDQLKKAKAEYNEAKSGDDPEKLFTACARLVALGAGGISGIVIRFTKSKAKKDWKAKEAAALPATCDAVIAELKAKAGVQ